MKMINVLWFEDEPEKNEAFMEPAYQKGIILHNYKVAKKACIEIESDIYKYDAVIMDAKAFLDSEHETATTDGLTALRDKLLSIRPKRIIPAFVYTGQPDLSSNEYFNSSMGDIPVFSKPGEGSKLLDKVNQEVANSVESNIKLKYHDALEVFDDQVMPAKLKGELIDLIIKAQNGGIKKPSFNALRDLLEDMFKSMNKLGILPIALFNQDKPIITWCSVYLAGRDVKTRENTFVCSGYTNELPDGVKNNLMLVSRQTNTFSHPQNEDTVLDMAFHATLLAFLDILAWYNKHAYLYFE